MMAVAPRLEQFTRDYPDVVLEVTTDDSPLDFVAGRFDAGIHLGEFIARDMIASLVLVYMIEDAQGSDGHRIVRADNRAIMLEFGHVQSADY
jgi:DNA-binding transcriptional LysR family regulator